MANIWNWLLKQVIWYVEHVGFALFGGVEEAHYAANMASLMGEGVGVMLELVWTFLGVFDLTIFGGWLAVFLGVNGLRIAITLNAFVKNALPLVVKLFSGKW